MLRSLWSSTSASSVRYRASTGRARQPYSTTSSARASSIGFQAERLPSLCCREKFFAKNLGAGWRLYRNGKLIFGGWGAKNTFATQSSESDHSIHHAIGRDVPIAS